MSDEDEEVFEPLDDAATAELDAVLAALDHQREGKPAGRTDRQTQTRRSHRRATKNRP